LNVEPCAVALKEWDAQVTALLGGKTAVLARKGGIVEAKDGFEVAHRAFWLYPTFLHQNAGELREGFARGLSPNPTPGEVVFNAFATVEGVLKLETLPAALTLEPVQALNAASLERRFQYKNRPVIHALLLRVYRTAPQVIAETQEYAGCVSWVNLEAALEVRDAQPVLEDSAFASVRAVFEALG
jgi:hypothetical protein